MDDNLQEEALNFENADETTDGSTKIRTKHAVRSQNAFRHIIRRAEAKGMVVNTNNCGLVEPLV